MTDGALIDTLLVPNPLIPGQPGGGTIAITATDSIFVTGQRPGTTNLLPSVPGLPTFTNIPSGIYSENVSANTGSSIVIQTPSLTLQPGLISSHAFGAGAPGDLSFLLGQLTLKRRGIHWQHCVRGRGRWKRTNQGFRLNHHVRFPSWDPPGRTVGFAKCWKRHWQWHLWPGTSWPALSLPQTLTMNGPTSIASSSVGPGGAGDVNIQAATIILTEAD